jgi:biotin carboxyl carrier protein
MAVVTKFKLVLDGVPYEIERRGDSLLVNGIEFPWSVNGNTVNVGGNTHTVEIRDTTATVDGITYPIESVGLEEKPGTARKLTTGAGDEAGAITAIMPGLVVKVLKKEGERVEAGEVVIVLEAMKMQNELHAKQSGVVKQVNVKEGESVEVRQVLAVIE